VGLITLFRDPVTFLTVSGSHYLFRDPVTFLTVSGSHYPLSAFNSFSYS
jgi:hypothetical protein